MTEFFLQRFVPTTPAAPLDIADQVYRPRIRQALILLVPSYLAGGVRPRRGAVAAV